MIDQVARSFEKLESAKNALTGQLALWTELQLRFKPTPATWSGLEIIEHLVQVEEAFAQAVKANLPGTRNVRLAERFGAQMVKAVMLSPIRIKVPPSATQVLPKGTRGYGEMIQSWDASRRKLRTLLEKPVEEERLRAVFQHPVSGWMTIAQGTDFLYSHLKHHGHQFKRLKRSGAGAA